MAQHPWTYPQARMESVTDTYYGVQVADPYRWLEDPDSTDSRAWIDAEVALTKSYLDGVPQREQIESRIRELWNFEKFGTPFKQGGKYFWSYNSGLQNQGVYFVANSLTDAGTLLLDPNKLKADGTMALAGMSITDDAKYMAYGIAEAGSDWNTWKVRDVATGQDLPDVINWVKFSGASWTNDGAGFFYSRFDEPKNGNALTNENYFQKLYFHKLGTPQSDDVLVYQETDEAKKDWGFGGGVTEDGKYLVINVSQGTDPKNRVYIKEIAPTNNTKESLGDGKVTKLLDEMDASYEYVGNDGSVFYFNTNLNAPRGRIIAINLNQPERSNWKEIIPQSDATLTGVSMVGNNFFANYLRDAKSEIKVFDVAGKFVRNVDLPGIGTAGGFGGKRTDNETFYSFAGFTTPTRIYRYDLATGTSTLFKEAKVAFNPDAYTTEQVFYTSKDGTKVPMFITYKKGLEKNGNNPTLLYGYGGFNISITPSFSITNLVWMEMGGVYASANMRGGGEYGEEWHRAGTLTQKQNVFDDFIAAGEWLIKNKYTTNKKLAIRGGSNGGLLIGACMTQRPDLFGACLPEVGVLDMLRFHRFTIGHAWRSDYGAADKYPNENDPNNKFGTEEQFKALLAYSPLHNIKKGVCYPPTMIMTGDHDDRVVPAHSFKFAAALQAAQGKNENCSNPTLIRIDVRAGHGAGKPTEKIIEEAADRWAFLVRALDMNPTFAMGERDSNIRDEVAIIPATHKIALNVKGMTCQVCVDTVTKTLKNVKGVKNVAVSLENKSAECEVEGEVDAKTLASAFEGTHFTASAK
ncbi:MAG: prolyl oligopeptidase family serine peptidase [Phycisphaerales bacterium]